MNATLLVAIWAVFGVVTLALAIYRWILTGKTPDLVHLGPGEERDIPVQKDLAQKLITLDRWGKAFTIITAVIGLALAGAYLYRAWFDPSAAPNIFYNTQ